MLPVGSSAQVAANRQREFRRVSFPATSFFPLADPPNSPLSCPKPVLLNCEDFAGEEKRRHRGGADLGADRFRAFCLSYLADPPEDNYGQAQLVRWKKVSVPSGELVANPPQRASRRRR